MLQININLLIKIELVKLNYINVYLRITMLLS